MGAGRKDTFLYLFIFYFLFSIFIFFLDSRGMLVGLRRFVDRMALPAQTSLFKARKVVLQPLSVFSLSKNKEDELARLREENGRLLSKTSNIKALEEENERARHLLGASLPASWHFEPARVISSFADRIYLTADFEPKQGTPVITSQEKSGVLVGQVESVLGGKIEVVLSTSSLFKTAVLVRDKETGARRAAGILVGQGGKLRLEQVLTSETVKEGDMVVTSGEGLPPEILVGFISKVFKNRGTFQETEVGYPVDLRSLDFVFLVTKW